MGNLSVTGGAVCLTERPVAPMGAQSRAVDWPEKKETSGASVEV